MNKASAPLKAKQNLTRLTCETAASEGFTRMIPGVPK
jgi:hypothetical protein